MENPFKKILHHNEVPNVLKKKVLNDIGMIKLTLDIADLFVVKYPNTFGELFSSTSNNNQNKTKN
ncbi:hypothetical protein [Polaribacter sp.]|uniref:hypothetical protein n=1 Tax=Polaribacter sp. TaxID=1920175 RepID=UPI003EF3489A